MNITTINNENCNSLVSESTQHNIFGLRKRSADRKRHVIEYVINEVYCNQINQACIYHKMDVVQLFTSAWILYKNLVTGNNPESIALVNNKNSVILASLMVNHEQTMEKYLDMASEYLSKVNEQTESGNSHSSNSPDILLYSLYSECCVYDRGEYDLTIGISRNNEKIKIIYEFNSDSISKQMLDLTHKRIMKICEQMSKKKRNYLNEITFLDDFELNQVLHEFNNSDDLYPTTKTIIELFEEQVVKTPNNIALEYEGQTLTYKQLNNRANYLGELLREQGVKSDSIVGIITKRSIEMVIGIYGVLKAGGAYLPIDPSLPIDRIRFMLNDSGTNVLLEGTESRHISKDLQNINVVDLCECKGEKEQNLKLISKPNNLAYVIYTSGTTGTPKGVMVENGNVVNLVTWMLKNEYHESEVILQKTTFTFDLSIWEFFVGYLAGAKLVLLPMEDEMDPSKIAEQIKKHHVTRTSFVPSVLEGFTSYVNSEVTQTLRKIQLSGEALPVELANRFNQICNGKVGLINSYGPTETTVFATSLDVPTDFNLDFVHIGRPISNTKIYILNGNRLCGIGMMGELCIGGEGVSRGYLNRPELTAEKFVENPFCEGEKIYRTGDLARWMEDGNIEYLGRIDEQVKIRGYRIEIDEVVSEMRNLEEIQNAVVIAREENNDKYLCGYVVGNGKLDSNSIKEQLRKKLPEYMIPAYIIQIESLPITRNGKLDKKALPKPEVISMVEYIAPRNDIEICIAKAFQDILGTDRIGIDDNFFELGGHSLRATKLVNVIEQELGVRIPLREVLTGNTVRNIAEKVRDATNYTYYTSIELQPQKDSYEMSSAQKRLFIIDQMKEGSISYNIPMVLKLKGSLNLERLNKALKQLCERHQILRTHFNYDQHKFFQMIDDSVDINLEYVEENEGNIQKVLTEFIRPFDLKKAPLMRAKAVKIAEDETIIMIDIHHIIYDDGSKGVLLGDLSRFYNGEDLPELNAQYKDFSAWQNARDLGSQGEYWLKEFSDDIPVLDLRTDYPRPQQQSHKGSSFTTTLSNELKNAVNGMSTKTGATQYMILLSSFMLLLSRYSRQEDIVVGSPIAGRIHPDTQNMLGMFVNTLAIKGKIGSYLTFIELLQQMKEKCLKAYENQEYPFEELVDKLEFERDLSRNPLFDVMFVFQNNEEAELKLGDTILSPVKFTSKSSTFDLTVSMEETADGYELNWEYCTDLFKQETIERMSEHFTEVLTDAVQNPDKMLSEMIMMSEQEKEKVLYTFNDTEAEYPKDKTIIELFEEQVKKTPDHIAVEFNEQTLSYKQLNARANYVGQTLRELGVKPDSIVGIVTDRSLEMIIGIYGILKAGGAYLPIHPEHPIDRIKYMIEDSETTVLLAGPGSTDVTEELQDMTKIDLMECTEEMENNLEHISKSNHLAYVIYTSGTTGKPKGVMVENRNISNLCTWQIKNGNYTDNSKIIQKTAYVFDGSVWEIFPICLIGGKLEIIDEFQNKDPEELLKLLPGKQIALMPSMFRTLLDCKETIEKKNQLNTFDKIYLAGEPVTIDLLEKYKEVTGNRLNRLNNLYGPTEATVTATSFQFSDNNNLDIVPIGKPILNTQIYILNGNSLCGMGMPGELCIGGAGVSRGYLNRPELTEEKFIENPYRKGERIYRTGDLARWMEDGNIEYLGRIDEQVKIRGFRIELDEIESKIRGLKGIQDAVVIVREEHGDKYICGYIVGKEQFDIGIIKGQLSKNLPEYMIPAYIIQIESVPITVNGKMDKKALPKPKVTGMEAYIAPRDEIEVCITEAFQEILGVEKVGINDSFFELGGHSLRATKLVNVLEEGLGVRILLREVLSLKTVRKIAEKVRESTEQESYNSIERMPKKHSYDMSLVQKRLYIIDQMQGKNITYNMPQMMRVQGTIDITRMQNAINQLIERHEVLRTSFQMEDDKPIQKIEDHVTVRLEFTECHEENIQNEFREFIRPFDLSKASLLRVKVVKISEGETILMLDIHHIIYDAVSSGIFLKDLSRLYNGEDLPELNAQYKDFSAWQNARDLGSQGEYWLKEFSDDIPVLDLRTDYPRPQHQSHKGNSFTTTLNNELKNAVDGMSTKTGATQYMILLSSFMLLLSRYSRQEDIVVGSPIAGRIHPDTQNMLGMFVNTLAIKGKIRSDLTFVELLEQMKAKCLKAYENQEYPFEELIDKLEFERDLSRNPLFDVMFVFQNNEEAELKLGDTILSPVKFTSKSSTFDLTVIMEETADGYELNWEYCTDLFKQETIERMSEHFTEVLTDAVQNPEKMLSEMIMMSEQEKEKVLYTFNDTEAEYPKDKTIIELFEEQVKKTPDHIAVEFNEQTLSYKQLNARANYVGQTLREQGVKPDSIVGIVTDRSLEMIIGIYGILKAGGAYLPIHPEHPLDRIKYMIEDSETSVLLAGPGSTGVTKELQDMTKIDLMECTEEMENNLEHISKSNHLAYVIYTSGTTGKPKGVMVENRNLANLTNWKITEGKYNERSVVLQKSTYVFDASVWEIFPCGLAGSKLEIISETQNNDPVELLEVLTKKQITKATLVPSVFRMLLNHAEAHNRIESLSTLDRVYLAAEPVDIDLLDKYLMTTEKNLNRLNNCYGPTEATVCATSHRFSDNANLDIVPIGKPIFNTQIYVLNGNSLCGIGMPGELCIGGASVSRGYLNRPELTAEKFVDNPYRKGERIYRTGDLARWMEDGTIEYLGRIDEQVKIRGFRIEIGEIESKLRDLHSIEDAVVVANEDHVGDKYLCGYIVGKKKLDIKVIKEQLGRDLPEYMIPAHIIQLESLPITVNGKLDKKALPKPMITGTEEYIAPRDEIEICIAEAFQEILGAEQIGIDDSFFELGGNSLRATRLVNIVGEKLEVRIPLREVLLEKTVRKLAEKVKELKVEMPEGDYFSVIAIAEEEGV